MKKIVIALLINLIFGFGYQVLNAQWIKCFDGGVKFNPFTSLAINGDRIFAATSVNGIYISSDNGKNWVQKNNGISYTHTNFLKVQGQIVFAGINGHNTSKTPGGLYFSTDNGESWKATSNNIFSDKSIGSMAFIDNIILVGTGFNEGVFMSSDNGISWTTMNNGFDLSNFFVASIINYKNRIFIGTAQGIFVSDDTCKTWALKKSNNFAIGIKAFDIIGDTIFAAGTFGFFRSTNKGDIWESPDNIITKVYISDIEVYNDKIFAATENGFYVSTNRGDTWIQRNIGLKDLDCDAITIKGEDVFIVSNNINYGSIYKAKVEDLISGIDENPIQSKVNIVISPNPVSDNISISILNSDFSDISISIFNSLGIEIMQFENKELSGQNLINIPTETFPQGIYFCTLTSGSNNITMSFVVIK
ncbi:MAG: glycoside hydrolase, family [Ignavibacteria bacterium]|nr:glycoside hydrolase, family [Ignavibacteria bacterium]